MTPNKFVKMVETGGGCTLGFIDLFLSSWDNGMGYSSKSIYHRYKDVPTMFLVLPMMVIFGAVIPMLTIDQYIMSMICTVFFIGTIYTAILAVRTIGMFDRFISAITFMENKCGFGEFGADEKWSRRGEDMCRGLHLAFENMVRDIAQRQRNTFTRDQANRDRKALAAMYQDILILTHYACMRENGTLVAPEIALPPNLGEFFKGIY
jgi:uncharacterized membrane protein